MKHVGALTSRDERAFDAQPIELPGFTFRARSVAIKGKPKPGEWLRAMSFALSAHEGAPYWIGDLINHLKSRGDWTEQTRLDLMAATGYALTTLENIAWVSSKLEEPERALAPSFTHAAEVAKLERPDQARWLATAKDEKLSHREMRKSIKVEQRTRVIDGQAALEGMYRVIMADPPWLYRQSTPMPQGNLTRAAESYPPMTYEEMMTLPVEAHAMPDAVLFCWVTASVLYDNPGPREVIEAWGFEPKTGYVWDKVHGMPGNYSYVNHEHLIVATRGSCTPDIAIDGTRHDSIFAEKRHGEHSTKPAFARQLITSLYTTGPYLELFGRKSVEGWSVFGNDARLWAMEAGAA